MVAYLKITNKMLEPYVEKGLITRRRHPRLPLNIYCYSRKCELEGAWDDITLKCRGLILDDEDKLVFRCVPKFFNDNQPIGSNVFKELLSPQNKSSFVVMEKLDGSAIWVVDDSHYGLIVASKTSFESDQANWATELIKSSGLDRCLISDVSYSFELIVPENRIVVDYGTDRKLVLWAMANNKFPEDELDIHKFGEKFSRARIICTDKSNLTKELADYLSQDNIEGVVIKRGDDRRVKVKSKKYLELHRIRTDCTPLRIWELLSKGDSIKNHDFPDEFVGNLLNVEDNLKNAFEETMNVIKEKGEATKHLSDKEIGLSKTDKQMKSWIFMLRNNQISRLEDSVWKSLRPKGNE